MNQKLLVRVVAAVFAAAALLGAGYVIGTHRSETDAPMASAAAATPSAHEDKVDPKTGRKGLYWHDPMVPNQHFDKPGKSPFMNMQLEPAYADEGGSSGIRIDAGLQQNLGIRYSTVRRENTGRNFETGGSAHFDQTMADVVASRVTRY